MLFERRAKLYLWYELRLGIEILFAKCSQEAEIMRNLYFFFIWFCRLISFFKGALQSLLSWLRILGRKETLHKLRYYIRNHGRMSVQC